MNTSDKSSKFAGAGLFAALVASLCCITPVFSLLAGIGGVAATFSWLEPFRPYLIALTISVLGFAWYQKLIPGIPEEIQCDCEEDEKPSFWQSKRFLGFVTVFAVVMLAFPYYSGVFFPDNHAERTIIVKENDVVEASLTIKGMTCAGCVRSVNFALTGSEGVIEASSSYENGIASVKYDRSKISMDALANTVEEVTGYKVTNRTIKSENNR